MPSKAGRIPGFGPLYRQIRHRPRLSFSVLVGIGAFLMLPTNWRLETRSLVAWDIAAALYLCFFFWLAHYSSTDKIRLRAKLQDDGAAMTLLLSLLAGTMCFLAITFELAGTKSMTDSSKLYHFILVAGTIPIAWMFIHSMFALHYAHEYYDPTQPSGQGLEFPGSDAPDYWDFIYFSFVIGTSGQTADVSISSPAMRKLATIHCVFAFFFNISLLGLTINVASSLL